MHLQKLPTFFNKKTCELDIVLTRTVYILTTKELVKLTMLWTTGPRFYQGDNFTYWKGVCSKRKDFALKESRPFFRREAKPISTVASLESASIPPDIIILLRSFISFIHFQIIYSWYKQYQQHNWWYCITYTSYHMLLNFKFGIALPTSSSSVVGLGGSVGCMSDWRSGGCYWTPAGLATFFRGDWSWNTFYCHSLPSPDSRRAVVSFWRKNVHNTC